MHVKALLGYTEIKAPFKGVVTRRNVHPGHFVQPELASGSNPLFSVARTDLLRVIAYVPEADAPFVAVGTRAQIRVPALGNKAFPEPVQRTSVALDSASRTLRVEMDLKNNEQTWRPGLYAYVDLAVERPDALIVPASAVFVEAGQSTCAAVKDGKVERKTVEVGIRNGGDVQIISGLKEIDQLIAKYPGSFSAGQPVEVAEAEPVQPPTDQKK